MEKYWKSIEDKNTPKKKFAPHNKRKDAEVDSIENIFDDKTFNAQSTRRDFLKVFGFSIASAAVAASCEQPVRKAIPYLIRPKEITPGVANYYASTFFDGKDYCSILVKVRDGRPIKIEGNDLSPINRGGTSAIVQASVLNLYDDARYQSPSINRKETDWETCDKEITGLISKLDEEKKNIVILSHSLISPSGLEAMQLFQKKYPRVKLIQYDTISASGMLLANKLCFATNKLPSCHFDKAELIVSFGADFLGTWLSPVEFAKQYASIRSLSEGQTKIAKHIQFEAGMSLTGSNADERIPVKPSQEKIILANLYNKIAKANNYPVFNIPSSPIDVTPYAEELLRNKQKSIIVSGSNDTDTQIIVNAINLILGNYGHTLDLEKPMLHRKGSDREMQEFVASLNEGRVSGVIFFDCNPVYDYPESEKIARGLSQTELSVSISSVKNETAELVTYLCPSHHFLESWGDFEIKSGVYSLSQPAIHPLFNTRQGMESILRWSGIETSFHDFMKGYWEKNILPKSGQTDFFSFWNKCLSDGVFELPSKTNSYTSSIADGVLKKSLGNFPESADLEITLYEKVGIGDGRYANNPWLQEMPDPVTRATWDNYLCISPKMAEEKGWKAFDVVTINNRISLPILVQPGQAYGTISVALGYGRTNAGKVAEGVGSDVYSLLRVDNNGISYSNSIEKIEKTDSGYYLALTQTHHSMEGRPLVREASLKEYEQNPASGNELHKKVEEHNDTLYKEHDFPGHHWGMAIDLGKCIGCSACLIACSAENNVPVVGKDEVLRAHEMHWIRIDRYYSGNAENPAVVRQPVMCQHCDNAPCENVCPVAATNHSDEGINQMAYNRCIGTRYCNNNCPYKVRRFNWFDYTQADSFKGNLVDPAGMTIDLRRMVLNPDVTVRAKGVIEKCSFCIQRIQASKLTAKLEDRVLKDGEILTACQQACPAEAIVFGDTNDPNSKVSKLFKDPRNYHLLEELHVLPSVGYLTKISHREQEA